MQNSGTALAKFRTNVNAMEVMLDYQMTAAGKPISPAEVMELLNDMGEGLSECFDLNSLLRGYISKGTQKKNDWLIELL